jgi:S-adenosylmethionine:tRNA ribosyltransferase-isomerase
MRTEDFDFFLPEELIAQFPATERDGSRLLRLDGNSGAIADHQFRELPHFLNAGDVLIFNDTRVIKARLQGHKESGGSIELLIERPLDTHRALAHIRASRSPKPGSRIFIGDGIPARVIERQDDLFLIEVEHTRPLLDLLDQYGALPLPPYITHAADAEDDERYQTVYAKTPGAVAAPTAGLHFNQAMLDRLQAAGIQIAYVTLHVGAGTFQPVRVDDIREHRMHSEIYTVPPATVDLIHTARAAGHKITAVGTTALRALESAARTGSLVVGSGETDIFITPGYRFQVVERLLTNFHLPKSTLMMLVSAFAGVEHIRAAYAHAIASRYRFFSYGDAMLLERREATQ